MQYLFSQISIPEEVSDLIISNKSIETLEILHSFVFTPTL